MTKEYTSLGLMSGTSGDGVDASIIKSDGKTKYTLILDKYFKYDEDIYENIHELKQKLYSPKDLVKFSEEINNLERACSDWRRANYFGDEESGEWVENQCE